ncbi:MAG: orotidine-5'-phosphate decarboxylase [Planctomycetota bacterium]|nr:orotidine-5'-phosphate decarboxylase [Planctomycetota bacterium]
MNFADQLIAQVKSKGNAVCVGLDPRFKNLPPEIRKDCDEKDYPSVALAYEQFCQKVIDRVSPIIPIIKPQSAFFEVLGPPGLTALSNIIQYATTKNLLVLMDAKRGDIGSTAEAYAKAYLGIGPDGFSSNALTVNPYMGVDTLQPFVETAVSNQKGIFVLVKTSNPGSGQFQDQVTTSQNQALFELVADEVESLSKNDLGECGYGPIGAVVGATYPEQLISLRARMPHSILLIPGFGAQGGAVDDVRHGFDSEGIGAIVNSSRGIIFAYENEQYANQNWESAIESACHKMAQELSIDELRH